MHLPEKGSFMVKNKKKIRVLITAVGGRSVGYQILECLKPFRKEYTLITTDMDPFSPGLYEGDAGYLLPAANAQIYKKELFRLIEKEKIEIILPGSHQEIPILSEMKGLLQKKSVVALVNDIETIRNCSDKLRMYTYLSGKNITTPKTRELTSVDEAKDIGFPLVLKPSKDTGGSKNVHIVKNMQEFTILFRDLQREGIQLIAQEYVGTPEDEYTVGIIVSKDGTVADSIVMRRKLTGLSLGQERVINGKRFVLSTGYSQGFFVKDPVVQEYCEYVAKAVGARGPLNIQCRKVGDKVYIFEIHTRFSGSASMRAEVGFNEPHILIQDFLGIKKATKVKYTNNVAVIRKFANTVVSMEDYQKMSKKTI